MYCDSRLTWATADPRVESPPALWEQWVDYWFDWMSLSRISKGTHSRDMGGSSLGPPVAFLALGSQLLILYSIGSQSAPYGALGLHERNLGAPRAIRLLIKILTRLILQLSKEAITALIKFIVGLRKLWSISSWAP